MRFLIVSHVIHKFHEDSYWAYGPYIREMNIWEKYIDKLIVVAPVVQEAPNPIDLPYISSNIHFVPVPAFNFKNTWNIIKSLFLIPFISWKIFWAMSKADHIHLRCPGNMGLLGSILQIFFPRKNKTAKYAGNWDPKMKKIRSYNLQRTILANTNLTRNMKVLVYGDWPNQSKNILSFFTASYRNKEVQITQPRSLDEPLKCLFCGFLMKEKRPIQSVKAVEQILKMGKNIQLTLLGNGPEFEAIKSYISENKLGNNIFLKGNVNADEVKRYMQESHFLTFYGHDSEGWPKVVAESMFWGCVPLVRSVSCTAYMLGFGERGRIVEDTVQSMVDALMFYLNHPDAYRQTSTNAMVWSRQYTLERFEEEIEKLL